MSLAVLLLAGMLLIVLAADYFTNAVEWVGRLLRLGEGAVGSILAALGTALPETLVPLVALWPGQAGAQQVGIGMGAIIGAPFMLATLGFAVIGAGLWLSRGPQAVLREGVAGARRDLGFFLAAYALVIAAGVLPPGWRRPLAAAVAIGYGWHLRQILRQERGQPAGASAQPPLHLWSRVPPPLAVALLQLAMALGGLMVGAHFFVAALERLSGRFRVAEFLLAAVVTPVATELPEVLNSVIWIRRRRDALALGNVTGAMAFQASVVPALGMALAPWRLSPWELATAILGWLAAAWAWRQSRRDTLHSGPLLASGLFYLVFIGLVAAARG